MSFVFDSTLTHILQPLTNIMHISDTQPSASD